MPIFGRSRRSSVIEPWLSESLRWYLVLLVATWAVAPVGHWLLSWLPDRGASVGRPLALLAIVWPTWFLAGISPVPYTTAGLWLSIGILGLVCWGVAWRQGRVTRDWIRTLLLVEAISAVLFFAYVGLRGFTPEIAFTEKPMDIAFLSSSARTTEVPPADPWFSGESINYYYLGYFIHGALSRLANVPTGTGYNLALASTASMAAVAAAGCAFNAARAWLGRWSAVVAAGLAGFMVVLAGNMHAASEFLKDPANAREQWWWGTVGWGSSRIVVDTGSSQAQTINEFPWFSLLLGDLHPHLTALPFTFLVLTLAMAVLLRSPAAEEERWQRITWLVVAGAITGALYPLNSLDLPTYLVLLAGALLLRSGLNRRGAADVGLILLGAVAAWLPFSARFVPFAGSGESNLPDWLEDVPIVSRLLTALGFYTGEHTSAGEFLTVFGFPWAIAMVALVVAVIRFRPRGGDARPVSRGVWVGVLAVLLVTLALPAPVLILAGIPSALALWLVDLARKRDRLDLAVIPGMIGAAFGLVLVTEFFYVEDSFSGRYNTLFKVYYQVWALLGIACAVALIWVVMKVATQPVPRAVVVSLAAVGLLAASAYPAIATPQWLRVHGERNWQGLDGIEFMTAYSADDVAAIRWLIDNAEPDDVIVEAPGCSYQVNGQIPTARLAAFTGLPNIIGWDFHEVQWRGGQPDLLEQITQRANDVAAIYADPSSDLVDAYDATLLFVGNYERFGAGSVCEKAGPFPGVNEPGYPGAGWEPVFTSGTSTIYRRTPETN